MATTFRMEGLNELRVALRQLPPELVGQARRIIQGRANGAAVRVRSNYAATVRSGAMRDSVEVEELSARSSGAAYRVSAWVKYAHWYEEGTKERRTSRGAARGRMPAATTAHAFTPPLIDERRGMYRDLADLLRRAGLAVRGEV